MKRRELLTAAITSPLAYLATKTGITKEPVIGYLSDKSELTVQELDNQIHNKWSNRGMLESFAEYKKVWQTLENQYNSCPWTEDSKFDKMIHRNLICIIARIFMRTQAGSIFGIYNAENAIWKFIQVDLDSLNDLREVYSSERSLDKISDLLIKVGDDIVKFIYKVFDCYENNLYLRNITISGTKTLGIYYEIK